MSKYEQYEHHDKLVWVDSALKGKHRDRNLCFACSKLMDCSTSKELYELCIKNSIVIPTAECPDFEEVKAPTGER